MVKQKINLPNKIITIPNLDKTWHEEADLIDLANMPHPSRILLCGPPNSGKTLIIKNMLLHKQPIYDRICIYHNDPSSKEYDEIEPLDHFDEIPTIDEFDENEKTLFILEDISFKDLNKSQKALIDRYFGCWSTHHNISVWATFQDPFSAPATIRRMSNIIIIWKNHDLNSLSHLSSRLGIKTKDLRYIFDHICTQQHDSLIIDTTRPKQYLGKILLEVIPYLNNAFAPPPINPHFKKHKDNLYNDDSDSE